MKRLLLGVFLVAAAGLAAACGDNGSDDQNPSPTAETGSPTPAASLTADEIITLTKELPVLYREPNPDGTFQVKPSTMAARVDVLCADDPQWSTEEGTREWRVYAECRKDESASGDATPPPYGYERLSFVWLFYPDTRQVMPVSPAAHDAQYAVVQPSTIPAISPIPKPTSFATP